MLAIKKDFFKSTRFKTTLWYAFVFLLLEVISWAIVYSYLQNGLYKDLDDSLTKQALAIYDFVSNSKVNLQNFEPDSIYTSQEDFIYDLIFDVIALSPRNAIIQVKLNNKLIFQSENLKDHLITLKEKNVNQLVLIDFNDKLLSDSDLRAAYLVKNNYEIIVAFPTVLIIKTLQKLDELIVIIGPLLLLVALIGGALISAKSLSRIDSIINRTKEITAQNLNEKIPGGDYNDEYGRLVRTMNDMISRIKTSIDYMNQFSMAASHELKTPLTILRGEIELALKSPKPGEAYREVLQSNYEETLRLINIVNKLFFLSKVDHSFVKLNKEKMSLSELIEPLVEQMLPLAKRKNMNLELAIKEYVEASVDVDLMRGAISNLIENAIKYGYENTTIQISCDRENSIWAVINVTNKGETIPKEYQERIFERFFRMESSRSRETGGVGLGLSIVKSIVSFHNGTIRVFSDEKDTNRFSIYLNLKEA
jgi:heavy metal sensor kinase